MSTRRLRTFLRALLWLDCGAALVCFLLPFRYGILALTYPLAFGLSWRLSRPDQRRGRSVLAALTAGFAVVVTGSGLMSWLAPQLDDARVGFITLHAMTGAHWMLLVIPPLARHIRRGLTLPGRAQWSGQAALAVARLSFWPAIVGGTIAIGPLWLRTWHVWFLVPALVALALHALVPRIRRAGLAGWRPAAIGAGVGSALFVFACWANSRPAPEPPARATYAANPPLDARPAATTTEGGHTVPEELVGGSERCADGACHPRVTDQWRRSAHHRSANVFYRKAVEIAVERHGWTSVRLCASCHDPVALLTGYYANRPAALFGPSADREGVSCLACHRAQITLDHVGSGSYRFDPPRFYVGPPMEGYSVHAMRPAHIADMLAEDRYTQPALCGECHSLTLHGPDGLALLEQDTYGEWRKGPFGDEGVEPGGTVRPCVSCHMPKIEYPDRPGPREASHRFLGASTHLSALAADAERLDDLTRFLKSADIELGLAARLRPSLAEGSRIVDATVAIRNRGVGHGFPTGALDLNEAWVVLEVRDAVNRTLWSSSPGSEESATAPQGIRLRRVFRDRDGRAILDHDILSAVGHLEDLAVPAGARVERRLEIPIAADVVPPLEVRGRLEHRGINRAFARLALGEPLPELPVTVIAEHAVSVAAEAEGGQPEESRPRAASGGGDGGVVVSSQPRDGDDRRSPQ